MDQAAGLRDLMNKIGQNKGNPIGFISTSDFQNQDMFLQKFAKYSYLVNQKTISLIGTETNNGNLFKYLIIEDFELDEMKERLNDGVEAVSGKLSFVSSIKNDIVLSERFIKMIENMENTTNQIFYYAGEGLNATAINLSLMTNKVIIMARPTKKSTNEIINLIKVFTKTNSNKKAAIIIDTKDESLYQEYCKKIQETCWKEFKYYIEPIGYIDNKEIHSKEEKEIFRNCNLKYLNEEDNNKKLSTSFKGIVG